MSSSVKRVIIFVPSYSATQFSKLHDDLCAKHLRNLVSGESLRCQPCNLDQCGYANVAVSAANVCAVIFFKLDAQRGNASNHACIGR
jgi:hypothetical protein